MALAVDWQSAERLDDRALGVGDVALQCHMSESTLRMWEQRYRFPCPGRDRAGNRTYSSRQVREIHDVVQLRAAGLSLPAAIDRVRARPELANRSLCAELRALGTRTPLVLRASGLQALVRAAVDECLVRGEAPILAAGFAADAPTRIADASWRHIATRARFAVVLGALTASRVDQEGWLEIALPPGDSLATEQFVVVETPSFGMAVAGWQRPPGSDDDGIGAYEVTWTLDPDLSRGGLLHVLDRAAADLPREVDDIRSTLALSAPRSDPAAHLTATDRIIEYLAQASTRPDA